MDKGYFVAADIIPCYPDGRVILIRRKGEPFKGKLALPGGHVDPKETVEQACAREAREEIGLAVDSDKLVLVGIYSDPKRDPRPERRISVCYFYPLHESFKPKAGSDASECVVLHPDDIMKPDLAFDHFQMMKDADLF
jgi:8-oxo-dGTP diphosphatase